MLKRKKSVRPCHLRTMKEEREQGISHVHRQGRSEWCLRRTWKCFWCFRFNACYPFHLLNDSKEKKILNAADHRSEAMRGIPKCCWKRKLNNPCKIHPFGKTTATQRKVVWLSPFMCRMHDLNLEYWQAFCCFYFGFPLPTSLEMSEKNLETC